MERIVKNTSDRVQCIHWFVAFEPWEVRSFTNEDAEYILANPFFAEIEEDTNADGVQTESAKKAKQKISK